MKHFIVVNCKMALKKKEESHFSVFSFCLNNISIDHFGVSECTFWKPSQIRTLYYQTCFNAATVWENLVSHKENKLDHLGIESSYEPQKLSHYEMLPFPEPPQKQLSGK